TGWTRLERAMQTYPPSIVRCLQLTILVLAVSLVASPGSGLHAGASVQPAQALAIGRILPQLDFETLSGDVTTVRFRGEQDTVLFFVSAGCEWCARNTKAVA